MKYLGLFGIALIISACSMVQQRDQQATTAADAAQSQQAPAAEATESDEGDKAPPVKTQQEPAADTAAKSKPAQTEPAARTAETAKEQAAESEQPAAQKSQGDGKKTVVIGMQPNHFHVTLTKKDPNHPQFGVGSDMAFEVNGKPGKELVLERGETYYFDVDTNVKHDFYLSSNSVGWGSGVVTDGVKGQFTYKGIVTFQPTKATPSVLYYQCRNHKAMGWKIHVVNKGEKPKLAESRPRQTPKPGAKKKTTVSAKQVKQKIQYAKTLIKSSSAAKRVKASANNKALDMLKNAEQLLVQSEKQLTANQTAEAKDSVDEALRTMLAASKEVPANVAPPVEELEQEYAELLEGIETFKGSYERTHRRAKSDKQGKSVVVTVDLKQIDSMVNEAGRLHKAGNIQKANELLDSAQHKLTAALNKMLASQTVVYELKFDTPKDEYEYEVSKFESYQDLIPLAIERKRPAEGTVRLMRQYEKKANAIFEKAAGFAKKGDYKTATEGTREATKEMRRALRLVGV